MPSNLDTDLPRWLGLIHTAAKYQKLFITGCPKSGTTWLVNSLNGHPEIVAAGEGRFAWRLFPLLQQAGGLFNTDQKCNAGTDQAMVTEGELHLAMRVFSENVFIRYLIASGKSADVVRVLADKTPQHILSVPLLRTVYPSCKFINIVRDPRDAATSALFHLAVNDPRPRDEYVQAFITLSWKMHVEAAVAAERELGSDVILNVRYEDMHGDEEGVIRGCLEHLGVEASAQSIQACREAGNFERLSGGRSRGQTDAKSFYRSGTVGDWRNHLDANLARHCCEEVKSLMDHFGYEIEASEAGGLKAAA